MKIGKIISVEYDKFRVRLFHSTRNSTVNIDGKVYYFGNIGSYLKTSNSLGNYIICEVIAIADWISKDTQAYSNYNLDSSREIIIKPIGTLDGCRFSMGVGIFPSLYSDVEIVTYQDLDLILLPDDTKPIDGIHKQISIGYSKSLINYEINLDINHFFNIHTAVLGNSGSGKSNTIAHVLHEVYRKSENHANGAKTIIFDANGEYPNAFGENSRHNVNIDKVFYKPNIKEPTNGCIPFYLPYYLMNLDEWLSFLMASERTQKPFWDRVLQESYKFYKIFNSKDDSERFANYLKWKLRQMLYTIVTRVESDTSKMTAAKGAIAKIRELCISMYDRIDEQVADDIQNYLDICTSLSFISFGNNNNSLAQALSLFVQTEEEPLYVYILDKGNNGMALKKSSQHKNGSFKQINEEDALKVHNEKLSDGEYFDYQYLRTAVEIVLLEEESMGNLHIRDFISTMLSRLNFFLNNPECEFMREKSGKFNDERTYLSEMFGISDNQERSKQLIAIDSSEVGTDVLELMTSVVSRMIFDYRKRKFDEDRRKRPIHLILDEAHRYIRKDATYIMRENIFEKIAREGRKYSLFLIISSQRPSELSQTVLSQCGNYIVHRIQNEVDMKYIYSVLPYFSDDYTSKIKQAIPGEALIFGNCVPMPLMVKVTKAEPAPNSDNCIVNEEWFRLSQEEDKL